MHKTLALEFTVTSGHQVASGLAKNSPFPEGTISMQTPYFKSLGLDISQFYPATINAQFPYCSIELIHWDYYFKKVQWAVGFASEDFAFAQCKIVHQHQTYNALIYQPVKSTKIGHQQAENCLEILAPHLIPLCYGDRLSLIIASEYLRISE